LMGGWHQTSEDTGQMSVHISGVKSHPTRKAISEFSQA
jgi:hypothetical protein